MALGKYKKGLFFCLFIIPAVGYTQTVRKATLNFENPPGISTIQSSESSIIINYSLPEATIESITGDSGKYYHLTLPGHIRTTDPGKPELPVLSRLITIPGGSDFTIRITDARTIRIKPESRNFEGLLYPAQEGETKEIQNQKPRFVIDKAAYSARNFIRTDTVKIVPLGKMRQKELAVLSVFPAQYNPRANAIELITSMRIEILFSGKGSAGIPEKASESALFSESLSKGILNFGPEDFITGYSDKPVRMVILTDTSFRKQIQPLVKWKTQEGYKLDILYKGAKFAGDTYSAIKTTLTNLYNSSTESNPAPDYLLIIGNTTRIPSYSGAITTNITDMYYGEFDGNGDYLPDMYIGRIPAADTNEVRTVVNKIIQYEKYEYADTNKFCSNAIMATGSDGSYANYINGQVKYAVTYYLIPPTIKESHFYYPYTPPSKFAASQKDSIIKLVNSPGVSFINYSGHGDAYGWLTLNIKVADTARFKNKDRYPFIISNACNTAQYNIANSFGNRMIVSKDKGAAGFIGCTNSSYWDEDFYWAVGLGTPSSDPKYETTGLGALDRLFHTHSESAADWDITLGQINYAGNLAVSSSTSSRKKYYWETYNVLGDPSMLPIIGTPGKFNDPLPDTLPNGIKSFTFSTDRFTYAAVSRLETLWDASFASPSGSVTLDMPGVSNDSCLFVLTGQNKKPLIKKVYFANINSEFINLSGSELNDSLGNNNGLADFGEKIFLRLKISNLGKTGTDSLYAKIRTTSGWVTINTDSVFIGSLPASTDYLVKNKLSFTLAEDIPDQGLVTIELTLKDKEIEKHFNIDIKTHAPKLSIASFQVMDSQTGNGDFIPDPGEKIQLVFSVSNTGSCSTSGQLNISSVSPELTIPEPNVKSGPLDFGKTTQIPVLVNLPDTIASGTTVKFTVELDCPPFDLIKTFSFRVGQVRESFESAGFRVFPWINRSAKPWIITSSTAYDGKIAAVSGAIGNSTSTSLIMRAYYPASDSLKFQYKVSSELNYDYLIFKVNDTEVFRKSGETGWEKKAVKVPAGYNKLEWMYKKDQAVIGGSDCAWIDMIDFATAGTVRYIRKDILPARLVTPVQKDKIGKEIVTAKVLNIGPDTLKGFNLAFAINKSAPVKQFFTATLIPFGDSVSVTFTSRADFSRYGIYDFKLYGTDNGDDYLLNDTITKKFEHTTVDEPILAFPNPFTSELNVIINSEASGTARLTLTNQAGKVIYDEEKKILKGENEFILRDRNLAASIYYLKIEFPGVVKVIPVIKTSD